MSLQRVEAQHRTRLCQKYPNNSPRQDMEDSQLSGFGVRIRLRLGKVLHEGAERPQQTRTRKATPAIGWETTNSRSSHGLSLPFPESLTWSHLWTQTRASLWVISTDRPLITVRPHQSVSEQSEKKKQKKQNGPGRCIFLNVSKQKTRSSNLKCWNWKEVSRHGNSVRTQVRKEASYQPSWYQQLPLFKSN